MRYTTASMIYRGIILIIVIDTTKFSAEPHVIFLFHLLLK